MTPAQLYAFETTGMLIVRDFYDSDKVEKIKNCINLNCINSLVFHKDPELFMDFMSDNRIVKICKKFIGLWFRFDHELAVSQSRESKPYLHGGQFGSHGTCFHHSVEQSSWNGQLTVGLCLTYQNHSTGGFSYVPGSQNYIGGGQYGKQQPVWEEVMNDPEIVRTPTLNPGDLYVFSEAVAHGQRQWHIDVPRQTMYLKYVPGYMAWQDYEITKQYLQWAKTPLQHQLLERPYTRMGNYASDEFRKNVREDV